MFLWLFIFFYTMFWTVRSSMNYEFGSNRRRQTIRAVVIVGTCAAIWMLSFSVWFAAGVTGAWSPDSDPAISAPLDIAITTACGLILGYLIPKTLFRFVGTKPDDTGESHGSHQQEEPKGHGYAQPLPEYQHPSSGIVTRENQENGKSSNRVKITAGVLIILAVGATMGLFLILKEDTPSQETLAKCDAWLQQQLLGAPSATANADNGNIVVEYIQSQRPDSCPPKAWNPLVTSIAEDHLGNIDIQFATTGTSRDNPATTPADGTLRWAYSAAEGQWYSSKLEDPTILIGQQTAVPKIQNNPNPAQDQRQDANLQGPDYAAFAAQRTRTAPAKAAFISQSLASADETMTHGQHHQWELGTHDVAVEQRTPSGHIRSQTVRDETGQQYTCITYADGSQVPRVNLAFQKELNYAVIRNQAGEFQGNVVNATTTIGKATVPLDWRTWATRTDKIRLRGADATKLVQMLNEKATDEFRLNLPNNPEMSGTYDVSNLTSAMASNEMTCFESR